MKTRADAMRGYIEVLKSLGARPSVIKIAEEVLAEIEAEEKSGRPERGEAAS